MPKDEQIGNVITDRDCVRATGALQEAGQTGVFSDVLDLTTGLSPPWPRQTFFFLFPAKC
ncbi:hypothetical protein R3X27_03600 [Tropicimonas sp. TH_r6]|uniref:hypothetical protein n=1 Tax=Tropicimonas sp. TH_r6 TaxID=3082085 RepID=UPI0029533D9A|nr:hypothetical protein [Tropicimonas sp. TH_r6]MDV7141761.1 hypothetical protein [Tropicimonas sp. TH_r6]